MSNDLESEWMEVCDERDKLRSRLQVAEEALEAIGQIKRWPWGYSRAGSAGGEVIEWMCHSCHGKFDNRGDENGQCPAVEGSTCDSARARRALATIRGTL